MPRRPDSTTRHHFRTFQDESHTQKRAFCLHCQKDACADNTQRMRNHLQKCQVYLASQRAEPVFQLHDLEPAAPDSPMAAMPETPHTVPPPPAAAAAAAANMQTATTAHNINNNNTITGGIPAAAPAPARDSAREKAVNNVRMAMARSTSRLTDLENVHRTQLQDGMQNAATHVRAAIRDEKDRLFKLAQTLVAQETKMRETQDPLGGM